MAVRIIREELTDEHRSVLIDDPELFVIVRDYVSQFNPELAERVELYDLSTNRCRSSSATMSTSSSTKRSTVRCGCPRAGR